MQGDPIALNATKAKEPALSGAEGSERSNRSEGHGESAAAEPPAEDPSQAELAVRLVPV